MKKTHFKLRLKPIAEISILPGSVAVVLMAPKVAYAEVLTQSSLFYRSMAYLIVLKLGLMPKVSV